MEERLRSPRLASLWLSTEAGKDASSGKDRVRQTFSKTRRAHVARMPLPSHVSSQSECPVMRARNIVAGHQELKLFSCTVKGRRVLSSSGCLKWNRITVWGNTSIFEAAERCAPTPGQDQRTLVTVAARRSSVKRNETRSQTLRVALRTVSTAGNLCEEIKTALILNAEPLRTIRAAFFEGRGRNAMRGQHSANIQKPHRGVNDLKAKELNR